MLRYASLVLGLFLSGMAALVYQTAWSRMLQRVFGVSDLAVATVLASFFLGLGIGSALGAKVAKRFDRPAVGYAILEVAIALCALGSLLIIPYVHSIYAGIGSDASFGVLTAVRFGIALVILLPPTILMGATLPVLIAAVASKGEWEQNATFFYAANTLGAACGAGLTGLYFIPTYGTQTSVVFAAVASAFGALVVGSLWWTVRVPAVEELPDHDVTRQVKTDDQWRNSGDGTAELAYILAGVAGFASLCSEVLWTRVLRTVVHGTTQAFSAMLINYLVGIVLGSMIAGLLIRRTKSPTRLFGITQLVLALLTGVSMLLAPQFVRLLGVFQGDSELVPHDIGPLLGISAMLLLPIATALGTAIPIAWKIAGGGASQAPGHTGRVLAWNTIGGLLGSLLAGFFLVPWLGIDGSLWVVGSVHLLAALIAFAYLLRTKWRRAGHWQNAASWVLTPLVALLLGLIVRPTVDMPFLLDARRDPNTAIFDGPGPNWANNISFIEEGRNTTVTIRDEDGVLRLFNDGRPESGFGSDEPGFGSELAVLGGSPALVTEERERAMVIGLGAGHTATLLLAGGYERVEVIELEGAVVTAARILHERVEKSFPLDDERSELIVDDARTRLVLAEPSTYDAVVSQPSHPWLAGSSALYTREFFRDVRRALKDGGVLSLWVNIFRIQIPQLKQVVRTLTEVFPNVHAFVVEDSSLLLTAAKSDTMAYGPLITSRLQATPALKEFMDAFGLGSVVGLMSNIEFDPAGARGFAAGAPVIIDDRPALEFELAQLSNNSALSYSDLDRGLRGEPWISDRTFQNIPAEYRMDVVFERIENVKLRRGALRRIEAALPGLTMPDSERLFLEGTLLEAQGDVRGALAKFDAANTLDAETSGDELREAEGLYYDLIRRSRERQVQPLSYKPLLTAAFAIATPQAFQAALAQEGVGEEEPTLAELAEGYVEGGCDYLVAQESIIVETESEPVTRLATQCAARTNNTALFDRFTRILQRVRRAQAGKLGRRGEEFNSAGNVAVAVRYFRRALLADPSSGKASAELARLLSELDYPEEASQVLHDGYAASRGLSRSRDEIRNAASELGVDL